MAIELSSAGAAVTPYVIEYATRGESSWSTRTLSFVIPFAAAMEFLVCFSIILYYLFDPVYRSFAKRALCRMDRNANQETTIPISSLAIDSDCREVFVKDANARKRFDATQSLDVTRLGTDEVTYAEHNLDIKLTSTAFTLYLFSLLPLTVWLLMCARASEEAASLSYLCLECYLGAATTGLVFLSIDRFVLKRRHQQHVRLIESLTRFELGNGEIAAKDSTPSAAEKAEHCTYFRSFDHQSADD
jgi:hypothetical protein